ncbi:hypothetical protein KDW_08250 [Dictyobacter vulcani]|uniref:Transglutaminase-like domain-containing protein n=1 Tax=Dictyobacter vulcani TaxID=2607529 RepID=A0A5J4KG36_9CHLR|nr:transglutaminase domain-containing protein [Dictyobacter vulcani]GER86663.1 hypothetical protein KDW_08250 [Dictyobacter vulcani]
MRNAAMERLSKLITDPPERPRRSRASNENKFSAKSFAVHLDEGWFSFFLLALLVFCVTWCIQVANWVDNLNTLTFSTLLALIFGVWSAKQRHFPPVFVYGSAIVLGILFAVWRMLALFYNGSMSQGLQGAAHWFALVSANRPNGEDGIFFLFIIFACYILTYFSALLLYRWHHPWLVVVLNAVALIFNLNSVATPYVILLAIFLLAALLLLLRVNLYQAIYGWRRKGLRYSDDLSWDFMQTGIVITIGILLFSWLLPGYYAEPHLAQIWTTKGPLGQFANVFNNSFANSNNQVAANHGNFKDTLTLGGNPNLTTDTVFKVKVDTPDPQYLTLVTYDTYDQGWSIAYSDQKYHIAANTTLVTSTKKTHTVKQTIDVVLAPGEQQPYLLGASDIIQMSVPANALDGSGGIIAWLGDDTTSLKAGMHYTVVSTASSADKESLRAIPMPADAPAFNPNQNPNAEEPIEYFNPQTVKDFSVVPTYLQKDKRIKDLAEKIVAQSGAKTMYDKVEALESYLRLHYSYNTNIHPRAGADPVLWFLFDNKNHDGYCNYFSTAMTLMARSLGIPAREVAGYAPGTYDSGQYVIRGVDAHSWTQVYFAGYGWINFEPSASFKTFTRPLPDQYTGSSSTTPGDNHITLPAPGINAHRNRNIDNPADSGSGGSTNNQAQEQFLTQLYITLGSILILIVMAGVIFAFWWRRLFSQYSLATQLYGRVCTLAEWAGIKRSSSQTPYEYFRYLAGSALSTKDDAVALDRLADIYVRERWADPESSEHPRSADESNELPGLWKRLRLHLFFYVLRHPAFLRRVPDALVRFYKSVQKKRRKRKTPQIEF